MAPNKASSKTFSNRAFNKYYKANKLYLNLNFLGGFNYSGPNLTNNVINQPRLQEAEFLFYYPNNKTTRFNFFFLEIAINIVKDFEYNINSAGLKKAINSYL